jgi:hypothetical protein
MFCHIYIGKLKENGSLTELAGMVEQYFEVTDLYVGEGREKLVENVRFLTLLPHVTDLLESVIESAMAPTAIIGFDSSLSLDDIFLGVRSTNQDEFIELFTAEADFIGYYSLEFQPTPPTLFDPPA